MKILCSGHLVRQPVGGHTWHHLQYLLGFARLGHEVMFFEHYGWPLSCFDPARNDMVSDPSYGLRYLGQVLAAAQLDIKWCYLSEDGATYGASREELASFCRDCDVYFNLSNVNWIPEIQACRRRVLVDTDPAFTQIGAHGVKVPFSSYHVCLTYGEAVHRSSSTMPTAGVRWLPTRQPVVLEAWTAAPGEASAPFTTVVNWTPYPALYHDGRLYGQKDLEFEPFYSLPREVGEPMSIAANAPAEVRDRLASGGWRLANPSEVSRDPWTYQRFLAESRAEFCVAKHGYVATQCGWFSDRSTAYLASGRPVVVQDTGFSQFLPSGEGLLPWRRPDEARAAIRSLSRDYARHCASARGIVEAYFDSDKVLRHLLECSL
jgi:hypothetical protein